jgi:sugar phosphate isomerase/epimerase
MGAPFIWINSGFRPFPDQLAGAPGILIEYFIMGRLRVGLDAYSVKPLALTPPRVIDWAVARGAEGIQFSEGWGEAGGPPDKRKLKDLGRLARDGNLYLEWGGVQHIPLDPQTGRALDIVSPNRLAAEQAELVGARVVRSCSSGLMRWTESSVPTETLLWETAQSLQAQAGLFRDHGLTLALETHFEFTTFELLRLFEMCGVEPGDYLGVCLDTMNLLTMLEDPVAATRRVLPWVVATHIKDGGLLPQDEGLLSFTAEAGKGLVDLEKIVFLLTTLDRPLNLSLEDHGGTFLIPTNDPRFMAGFPDLTPEELRTLVQLAERGRRFVDEGRLAIVDRPSWAGICQDRVTAGLGFLRSLVDKLQ